MQARTQILVVDDNAISLEVFHEILDEDYTVVTASNADEALRHARQYEPQVVLLDVMLPGTDGYDLCRALRQIAGTQSAHIIMVSAKAMPLDREAGFGAGADAYLTKPFDDTTLLDIIRDAGRSNPLPNVVSGRVNG